MSTSTSNSVTTSQDVRSQRPTKRRALSPTGQQAASVEALFAKPDREIVIPDSATPKAKSLAPPPEIVQNVQGSSAGAGSGEFHVYKASRRREYERLRLMDEETQNEKDEAAFKQQQEEKRSKDDEKTRKNREKREKAKKRKAKAKEDTATPEPSGEGETQKKFNKGPRQITTASAEDETEQNGQTTGTRSDKAVANPEEVGITIHDDD